MKLPILPCAEKLKLVLSTALSFAAANWSIIIHGKIPAEIVFNAEHWQARHTLLTHCRAQIV